MIVRLPALLAAVPALVAFLSCSEGGPGSEAAPDDPLPAPDAAVTREALEQHVRFLAGQDLRGREAATGDSVRSARYLARCLASFGVEPAPGQTDLLIEIPLLHYEHVSAPRMTLTTVDGEAVEAIYGSDFRVVIRGEAVSTPVLPIRRADSNTPLPDEVNPAEALLIVGTPRDRNSWLHQRDMGDGSGWGLDIRTLDRAGRDGPASEPPAARLVTDLTQEDVCEQVYLRGALRQRLLANEFESIQITYEEKRTELVDFNVLGVIPGADPELSAEVVLFFANYDGQGFHTPKNEANAPRLRAGADDNATACAALLELAEAFAAGPPPGRTLAFLFLTGDKKRRFGLDKYLQNPLISLDRTIAALHLKRLGRPAEGKTGQLWLTGFQRTTLGPELLANEIAVEPDADSRSKNFMRADSFSFALLGVVSQSVSGSDWSVDDPFTDTADRIAYDHLESCTVSLQRAAQLLADGTLTPAWGEKGPPKKPVGEDG